MGFNGNIGFFECFFIFYEYGMIYFVVNFYFSDWVCDGLDGGIMLNSYEFEFKMIGF